MTKSRMLPQRLFLAIYVICFAIGGINHAKDFMIYGPRPYSWGPPLLEAFWTALMFLDAAVVFLLIFGKRRLGLPLALVIMTLDVAANSYASLALKIEGFESALPLQSAFLGFVLGSAPFLWPAEQ